MLQNAAIMLFIVVVAASSAHAESASHVCSPPEPEARIDPGLECVEGATTRVNVAVNLDADTPQTFLPTILRLSLGPDAVPLGPVRSVIGIRDHEARARPVLLSWARTATANHWIATVSTLDDSYPRSFLYDRVIPSASIVARAEVEFDAHGELLELVEIPATFVWPDEADSQTPRDHSVPREQHVVFGFRTAASVTTQYAHPSFDTDVEQDGTLCNERPTPTGACFLPRRIARSGAGNKNARIGLSNKERLMSSTFQHVQGRHFDWSRGVFDRDPSDTQIPRRLTPPGETERIEVVFELDENAPIRATDLEPADPIGTSSTTIPVSIFDSLGRMRSLTIFLTRSAPDRWSWTIGSMREISMGAIYYTGPPVDPVNLFEGGTGVLFFDDTGVLARVQQTDEPYPIGSMPRVSIPARNGANPDHHITFDFGIGVTRIGAADQTLKIEQDGFGAGVLTGLDVSPDYVLIGESSAGTRWPISKLAFASRGDTKCSFECSNRRDDDGDGLRDARHDPGCLSPMDLSERSGSLVCDDGRDNDGDGFVDYPDDPGCRDPEDDDEGPIDVTIEVVEKRRGSQRKSHVLVIAVLERGRVRPARIIPKSLRLEPGGIAPLEVAGGETRRRRPSPAPDSPPAGSTDVDCDGRPDRLFEFPLDRKQAKKLRGEVCLSGRFESGPERIQEGLSIALFGNVDLPRFEFRSCVRMERGWLQRVASPAG